MKKWELENLLNEKLERFIESDSASVTAAKFMLAIVALSGVAIVGAVAPGIFTAIRNLSKSKRYSDQQLKNAYYNLRRAKLINVIEEKNGKSRVELTLNGKKKVREFTLEKLKINVPKKWDKKWRLLIFDIPTQRKFNNARNALRQKIKELDFFQLQKSVWIHPFPCEEEILFVAETYDVEKYVEILIVEKLLHENMVKKEFSNLTKGL